MADAQRKARSKLNRTWQTWQPGCRSPGPPQSVGCLSRTTLYHVRQPYIARSAPPKKRSSSSTCPGDASRPGAIPWKSIRTHFSVSFVNDFFLIFKLKILQSFFPIGKILHLSIVRGCNPPIQRNLVDECLNLKNKRFCMEVICLSLFEVFENLEKPKFLVGLRSKS